MDSGKQGNMGKESDVCQYVVWQPEHCADTGGQRWVSARDWGGCRGVDFWMFLRSSSKDVVESTRRLATEVAIVGWLLLGMATVREITGL